MCLYPDHQELNDQCTQPTQAAECYLSLEMVDVWDSQVQPLQQPVLVASYSQYFQ